MARFRRLRYRFRNCFYPGKRTTKNHRATFLVIMTILLFTRMLESIHKSGENILGLIVLTLLAMLMLVGQHLVTQYKKRQHLAAVTIARVDRMAGLRFEEYLGKLFESLGYVVTVTRKSGDFGADLVLHRWGRKIVVQAKVYAKNVGIQAVQEVLGAINFYHAQEGWVITNRGYTKSARQLAAACDIRLLAREDLIKLINQANKPIGFFKLVQYCHEYIRTLQPGKILALEGKDPGKK